MKFYIVRPAGAPFVTAAESTSDAIAKYWQCQIEATAAGESIEPHIATTYRCHLGRADEAKTVLAAPAYWRLPQRYRPLIRKWVQDNFPKEAQRFIEALVASAPD